MSATVERVDGGAHDHTARPDAPRGRLTGVAARIPLPGRATSLVLVALAVLSLLQRPGRITFDTKLDLAVDPGAFLGRALHLWNPEATFGELQNQAYGYLFPVGPYFVLTDAVGVPTWIAQRLWCAILLCGAFAGALLLARALGIGNEPARYVGAVGYALAPRMLTEVGPLSVELLPAVLLPWVLLPLVAVHRLGSPRRAAALSGVAVLCMGGANAAMVLMALVLPGLWLLTRRWTVEHVRLVAWWVVSVLAATLWWIVPLLLLAGYSLPFLDYIESAANTTAPLSLLQVLRGTNQWIAYVVQGEPWWPAGFMLVDNPVLMAATMLVAGIGLLGLARRGLPERTFLLLGMLTGLVLLTVGHIGPLDSPVAEPVQRLLDGPLAVFRNVHKFDPALRLTLMLGLMHAVSTPLPASFTPAVLWRRAQLAVAGLLVLVVATPAWLGTLRPGQDWTEVPAHWTQAARWLAERDASARTLMLPATGFGEYQWGRTVDEPMQALAESPWAVRSQVPLGSEGNTRFMDAVSDAVNDGRGSPALADYLARAGVRFLLLRNDIDRSARSMPPVAVQRQALARSPGITLAATFGPTGPVAPQGQLSLVDVGADQPAIEVYEVDRPVARAAVTAATDVVTVSGGPESVLPLLEQGLVAPGQPTMLGGDSDLTNTDRWIVTDGLRRRERNVGRVQDNLSHTLADTDPVRQERAVLDVLPFAGEDHQTVAQYQGVRAVEASSSAGYADAFGETDPSHMPFAAVDGDRTSLWRSSSFTGPVGQWFQVQLDTPRVFDGISLEFADDLRIGWPVARIRITTDRGSIEHDVPEKVGPIIYPVFGGPSATVRVTVLTMRGGRQTGNVAIRELGVPGVEATRLLRAPDDVKSQLAPTFAFTRGSQPRGACYTVPGGDPAALRCDGALARVGEEPEGIDRRFRAPRPGIYGLTGTVLPRLGPQFWRNPSGLVVLPSSQLGGDPAVSARFAFDGDPGTSWVADVADRNPTLLVSWPDERTIDRVSFTPSTLDAANPPLSIKLRAGDEVRTVDVSRGTSATFEPLVTTNVEISIQSADQSAFAGDGRRGLASVGIAELRVPALADLVPAPPDRTALAGLGCGFGPVIEVDGTRYQTSVIGTVEDFAAYRPQRIVPCDELKDEGLTLRSGEHRIRALPHEQYAVHDLTLTPLLPEPDPAPRPRTLDVLTWDTAERTLLVSEGPASYIVVPENANPGWVATLDGRELDRARVDGWQQAWRLPDGAGGEVRLSFAPDRPYRTALLVGAVFVLLLLALAFVPARGGARVSPPVPSRTWWGVALPVVGLLVLLGGPVPLICLVVCLALRRVWASALPVVAVTGVVAATAVAVTGRATGHGQDWAFGAWSQLALVVAVAAVIAAFLYPSLDARPTPAHAPPPPTTPL
jgi:arabinofuranan 3-O-arabinosyltransferase